MYIEFAHRSVKSTKPHPNDNSIIKGNLYYALIAPNLVSGAQTHVALYPETAISGRQNPTATKDEALIRT